MRKFLCCAVSVVLCLTLALPSEAKPKKAGKKQKKRAAMAAEVLTDAPKFEAESKSEKSEWSSKETPAVPGTDRDFLPVAAAVDREIDRKLAEKNIAASPLCDDAEFLRRASLDLRGRIPSDSETLEFLNDTQDDKRRRMVDAFLADPDYGEHFGIIWYHRLVQENSDNRFLVSDNFRDWLADQFNRNVRWNDLVSCILTASGERNENPAVVFWLANIDGDAKREISPNRVAASACKAFLGVKIECCECHNHPFDDQLKQTDFWSIAAFFTGTHTEGANKKLIKTTGEVPGIYENQKPIKYAKKLNKETAPVGSIVIPDSQGKTADARFLLEGEPEGDNLLRPAFATWLTSPQNPYFAKAAANRAWCNMFGRGLVDPPDDLRAKEGATHPRLLDLLTAEFVASGFDLKHLIRCVCNSQAYQRTSLAAAGNESDSTYYSHMGLRMLTADMLFDSLTVALDHAPAGDKRANRQGNKKKKVKAREEFLKYFLVEADDDAGVLEDYNHGIPQALRLMNSDELNDLQSVVTRLSADNPQPEKLVDAIYVRVLSRRPRESEITTALRYLKNAETPAKGANDLMWALLNSSEFLFNH